MASDSNNTGDRWLSSIIHFIIILYSYDSHNNDIFISSLCYPTANAELKKALLSVMVE
jgi:hypothetical protein